MIELSVGSTWRSIWHSHKLLAVILIIEYSLTFLIVSAALSIVLARSRAIGQDSGIQGSNLYVLQAETLSGHLDRYDGLRALTIFRELAGAEVSYGSSVPFLGSTVLASTISVYNNEQISIQAFGYEGDAQFARALGVQMLKGRFFSEGEEVVRPDEPTHEVLISATLAQRLFYGRNALGELVSIGGKLHTVVGIIGPLAAPQYFGSRDTTHTYILPRINSSLNNILLVRYEGPIASMYTKLKALRKQFGTEAQWLLIPYDQIRENYFSVDKLTVLILTLVTAIFLFVSVCGVLGLTTYWLSQRRMQIAVRRALGARRIDILLLFSVESGLLVIVSVCLGIILFTSLRQFLLKYGADFSVYVMLVAMFIIVFLSFLVVLLSLRKWNKMEPVELIRAN